MWPFISKAVFKGSKRPNENMHVLCALVSIKITIHFKLESSTDPELLYMITPKSKAGSMVPAIPKLRSVVLDILFDKSQCSFFL